ncbi:hypothetical protein BASA50_009309 [Batrachochytrium salamandrivorans]|uniref:RING-type domain-containing protein n=1 Tax=Batrachochytrium salamandrivorans TaxID=1357716 RepID=A0ABQ8F1B9_9FUNG|nr:hypothetical protein BASA50_009309 [Batrachochytrium salamandrivorans]
MSDAGHISWDTCIAMTIFRYEFEWQFVGVLCLSPVRQIGSIIAYGLTMMILFAFRAFHSTIVRDLYMTLCSFIRRCGNLIKYHCATANMDKRYLNSTATELATMDRVCIICREEMVAVPGNAPPDEAVGIAARTAVGVVGAGGVAHRINPNTPKRLPCGHVFHFRCLRSWLERQQACPTCRRSVMDIPAQAPVQPAIVNPVAAVNPIAMQCQW